MEAAIIDHTPHRLTSLSTDDPRVFDIRLAGPAALLVAKLHKLGERSQERTAKRMKDKDALDVLRILRSVPSEVLTNTFARLRQDDLAGTVTREALDYLRTLFGSRAGLGTQMAVRATERLEEPETMQSPVRHLPPSCSRNWRAQFGENGLLTAAVTDLSSIETAFDLCPVFGRLKRKWPSSPRPAPQSP